MPAVSQALEGIDVKSLPFALGVRSVGSAPVRTFLPFEPKPAQVFEHGLNKFRFAPRPIQVFITQNEHTSMRTGPLLRGPERPGMT
jgi:hypothetical protein